ncbi:hypothetical protein BHM03_00026596 [Ensete ventricosum]|nr:hypothetical protein BHM03_00026596 [Ensete ventricosum]
MKEKPQSAARTLHSSPQIMDIDGFIKHQPITILADTRSSNDSMNGKRKQVTLCGKGENEEKMISTQRLKKLAEISSTSVEPSQLLPTKLHNPRTRERHPHDPYSHDVIYISASITRTCGGLGYLYLRRDSSPGGHVIAVVPDTLPTAYCQGCYRLVGPSRSTCHVAVHSPAVRGAAGWSTCRAHSVRLPAARWRGCRRLVDPLRLLCHAVGPLSRCWPYAIRHAANQVEAPALPARLIEAMSAPDMLSDLETIQRGQAMWSRWGCGVMIVGGSTIIRPIHGAYLGRIVVELGSLEYVRGKLTIGLKAAEVCNSGIIGLMVAICNSGTIGLMVADICNLGTIGLVVVEIHNSGTIGLMIAEIRNSSTIGLVVAVICNSGTIGLKVAEVCNSGTIGLKVAEVSNLSTIRLKMAEVCNSG